VRPLGEPHAFATGQESGVFVVSNWEDWQAFLAHQPAEQALRLRALEIDFSRESFVLACHTETSGSTKVKFVPHFRDDVLVIEVRRATPRGPVRNDVVVHHYAAVVERPHLRAELEIR
ncbi:MAG: hypothetical protein ACYTGZ_04255, partial [Planctomycetota bacterium]